MMATPPKSTKTVAAVLLATVAAIAACRETATMAEAPDNGGNHVYYWRTELRLDSTERAFITAFNIQKMYCRYFDVVTDDDQAPPHPNATMLFSDTMPQAVAVVPTVYITEECLHQPRPGMGRNIVERIVKMNATHGIGNVPEIQLDCDYTARSLRNYYALLGEARQAAGEHGLMLSVTIRLHQLTMEPPPADYGVLMLYNTGDPRNYEERNPVLDPRDVLPYLRHLAAYPLPLAAAYPVYQWQRWVGGAPLEHTVPAEDIIKVKKMVEDERPALAASVIIFALDKENINRYTPDTYEKIYHH